MQRLMQKLQLISEKLTYWGVFISLIFIPLYFKFPLEGVIGTFVSIRLDDILVAAVFFVWGIYLISSGDWRKLFKDRLFQILATFFFIGAVSLFSAIFLTKTVSLSLGLLHYLRRVELFVFLPLVMTIIKNKKQGYAFLFVSLVVLVIVNFYALGQRYLHFPVVSTTTSELSKGMIYYLQEKDRVSSTFAGFYDLAVYMLMAITIIVPIIYFFAGFKGLKFLSKEKVFSVVFLSVLSIVSFVILIMTATRLSFVGTLIGIFIAFVLIGKKRYLFLIGLLAIAALIYPSNLRDRLISTFTVNIQKSFNGFVAPNTTQEQRSQLNIPTLPNSKFNNSPLTSQGLENAPDITPGEPTDSTQLGVYRSFDIRVNVEWPRAIRALTKNPLLGTGYSSLGLATDNDFLRSLGEVGILGTICFVLFLIEISKRVWRIVRTNVGFTKYFAVGVMSMFVSFIINSLFIDVFEASKVSTLLWIFLGIALALGKLSLNEKVN